MNRSAPDFELGSEPYHSSAAAAVHLRRKAPGWTEDELMEIIWQNGLVALPVNRSTTEAVFPGPTGDVSGGGGVPDAANRFMEDDEMATWLNYQTAEDEDGGGLLHGELGMRYEPEATATKQEPTVVGSNATPTAAVAVEGSAVVGSNVTPAAAVILEEPRRMTASSSGMAERKRKKASGAGEEQPACHLDQDAEFESGERGKDDSPRYASVRKLRAAEIHNLSERRRRDRINEKMRALQELIPRCNKSDKASTLDEAIEYMKFLQLQVQVMSMRCNPGPVMFPGVQTYLPPMGMGMQMGLGMGMGMGLGMTVGTDMAASSLGRRMLQYGPIPCPPVAGHPPVQLGPGPLSSSFHLSTISIADQARVEAMKQQNHLSDTVDMRSPNVVQIPHIADPYHRFLSLHPLVQSQSRLIDEAGISKRNGNTESNNG